MKLVAGLGSIDEYIPFVEAGADEFFCGYVPYAWSRKYKTVQPLNRREVMNYRVQLGAFEELKILRKMIKQYGVPVKLALNSLFYSGEQYREIAELVCRCMEIGFDTFIIADPALILYLREQKLPCRIHLSGECAEINSTFLAELSKWNISRVIFHRKNTIAQMQQCIVKCSGSIPEYEAFFLNELCHFTGAYCNSLHCDELAHLCLVPYKLGRYQAQEEPIQIGCNGKKQENAETQVQEACSMKDGCMEDECMEDGYRTGETGCGLCALYDLAQAGVTHLKLVGRGNYTDFTKKDITQAKKAIAILKEVQANESSEIQKKVYQRCVKEELFSGACSRNCYYL